jgi:hypothetical protein
MLHGCGPAAALPGVGGMWRGSGPAPVVAGCRPDPGPSAQLVRFCSQAGCRQHSIGGHIQDQLLVTASSSTTHPTVLLLRVQ